MSTNVDIKGALIMSDRQPILAACAIVLAIGFNIPYAVLAATYDYPGILREPAGVALTAFHAGGPALIWTWYAFGLAALAFTPLAPALAITSARLARRPGLAVGAAMLGALAGVTQAMGLFRWVFAIPGLAAAHADPAATEETRAAAERAFDILNAYGGVAIGEHLGQLLTSGFVAMLAALQAGERRRITAGLGAAAALAIVLGTGEGLALALGASGDVFSLFTIAGFALLAAWLIAVGLGLMRPATAPSPAQGGLRRESEG
jgi:hypothetical protein